MAQAMNEAEFFEIFAAENILRNEHVDQTDIEFADRRYSKKLAKSDGGIDGFYIFADGKVIADAPAAEQVRSVS